MVSEGFGNEIMVGDQFVDPPKKEGTEGGRVKVGVDIVDGSLRNRFLNESSAF